MPEYHHRLWEPIGPPASAEETIARCWLARWRECSDAIVDEQRCAVPLKTGFGIPSRMLIILCWLLDELCLTIGTISVKRGGTNW